MAVRKQTAGHHVGEHLKLRISNGEWDPGDKLPSIRALAREYDVAPLTVSRVIRNLSELGMVTTIASKGVYMAGMDEPEGVNKKDTSWQVDLFRKARYRSFSFSVPQGIPEDTINFATGTMSNEAVPIESIRTALRKTARTYTETPVWTRPTQGELGLREWFSDDFSKLGIETTPESIVIVSSTHQAFRVIANSLIDPGDVVLIESPSDPIVIGVFELAGAKCIGMNVEPEGVNPDQVQELVARHRPKLIITCPTGQIPTGVTMSVERRMALAQIAENSHTLIIEYDNGNEIYFDSPPPKPIKSWDTNQSVAFIRDVSRITMAGYRINALSIGGPLRQRIIDSKRRDDLLTSTLGQAAMLAYVTGPDYLSNLQRIRDYYRPRRDAMIEALEHFMPDNVLWITPNVGFHVWLTLPDIISASSLAVEAALLGVVIAPGNIFSTDGTLDNTARLTFSTNTPKVIRCGVERLSKALRRTLEEPRLEHRRRTFELV